MLALNKQTRLHNIEYVKYKMHTYTYFNFLLTRLVDQISIFRYQSYFVRHYLNITSFWDRILIMSYFVWWIKKKTFKNFKFLVWIQGVKVLADVANKLFLLNSSLTYVVDEKNCNLLIYWETCKRITLLKGSLSRDRSILQINFLQINFFK